MKEQSRERERGARDLLLDNEAKAACLEVKQSAEETTLAKRAGPSERRRDRGEELLEIGQRREEACQAASAAERYRIA